MNPLATAKKLATAQPLPLPDYRFVVFLSVGIVPLLTDVRFQSAGPLEVSRTLKWDNQGPTIEASGGKTLTLKRGLTSALDGKPSALAALNLLQMPFWETRKLAFDVLIAAIDHKGLPKAAWKVSQAILTSLKWGELNADSGKFLVEEMTFDYKQMLPFTL